MARSISMMCAIALSLSACTAEQQAQVTTSIQAGEAAINAAIASACKDYNSVAAETQLAATAVNALAPGIGASVDVIIGTVDGVCNPVAQLSPNVAAASAFDLNTAVWIGQNTGALKALETQAKAAK